MKPITQFCTTGSSNSSIHEFQIFGFRFWIYRQINRFECVLKIMTCSFKSSYIIQSVKFTLHYQKRLGYIIHLWCRFNWKILNCIFMYMLLTLLLLDKNKYHYLLHQLSCILILGLIWVFPSLTPYHQSASCPMFCNKGMLLQAPMQSSTGLIQLILSNQPNNTSQNMIFEITLNYTQLSCLNSQQPFCIY